VRRWDGGREDDLDDVDTTDWRARDEKKVSIAEIPLGEYSFGNE